MYRLSWQKTVVALLVVLCAATFFACAQEVPTHGLEIVEVEAEAASLTQQQTAQLATALYGVMKRALSTDTPGQAIEEQLQKISQDMAQEVAQLAPTEREYASLMSVLQGYLEAETFSTATLAANLYVELSGALGKDKCAVLMHRILLYYCDYMARQYQSFYDQYGYDVLQEKAQSYRQKHEVFAARLSPADLGAGLNTYYILAAARSMVGQVDAAGILSTDEILMLVRAQNCTAVSLDAEVWYQLLSLTQDFVADKYYGKLLDTAIDNGDIRLLAEGMNDLVAMVRHVQMTIGAEDIRAIRQGQPLANVLFALLEDDQLRQIDALLSKQWHYDQYEELAQKLYGDDYLLFEENTTAITIDQLLEARRTASDVSALLVGYLAGKSYALAWEVQP